MCAGIPELAGFLVRVQRIGRQAYASPPYPERQRQPYVNLDGHWVSRPTWCRGHKKLLLMTERGMDAGGLSTSIGEIPEESTRSWRRSEESELQTEAISDES